MKLINDFEEVKNEKGLLVHLLTGTAWTKTIFFEDANENSDVLSLLDEAFQEMKEDFPVCLYDFDDLDEYEKETYLPLNGGEKYIEGVAFTEEV